MSRTVAVIDGEIAGVKAGNVDWMPNSGVMALITALTNEKNQLGECNNSDFMLLINIFLNFLMDFSFCEFILMIIFIYLNYSRTCSIPANCSCVYWPSCFTLRS